MGFECKMKTKFEKSPLFSPNNNTTTASSGCRQRMQSDSCLQTADLKEHSQQKAILRRKTVSVLQSPNLIQNLTESAKVKILPPPPKAFRDTDSEKIKVDIPKV